MSAFTNGDVISKINHLITAPPTRHAPVGVLLQGLDGLGDVAGVPEPHLAVIPAAGQVVLLVGVEVQVPHQLAVGVLDTVDLAGGGTHR